MSDVVSTGFLKRLEARRKELADQQSLMLPIQPGPPNQPGPPTLPAGPDYTEDIPELDLTINISPEQKTLDEFIAHMTIVDAYRQWCNKTPITPSGRREIKVSCPNPQHADKEASCSLNTEKNVFMCFICGGGDLWDIAAWSKGFPVPGYKSDPKSFRELRKQIGAEFGLHVIEKDNTGAIVVSAAQLPPTPPPTQIPTVANALAQEEEFERRLSEKRHFARIDWRAILPEGSFLHSYIEAASVDDCPEEFHFWNGLVALGFAVGRKRVLEDTPTVIGNLFVCLTGGTGTGKSKSKRQLTNLLIENLPWKKEDIMARGTRIIAGAQSGEILVKQFLHYIELPTGKPGPAIPGIKGLVNFEELAELVGKAGRQGSTLKELLQDLYDGANISSTSMTHGENVAEKPYGSLITTTQIKSIRALIGRRDDNSGFANRWVFATGVPKKQFAVNRTSYNFIRAGGLIRLINSDADNIEVITWTDTAEHLWNEFFHGNIIPFRDCNPDASIAQRVDLLLKKLFLLFAVNKREKVVSVSTVEAVLALYPHLMETYQIIDEQIGASEVGDDEDMVFRALQRMTIMNLSPAPDSHNSGPTARELQMICKSRIKSAKQIKQILDNFVALGLVEKYSSPSGPSGGRPTVRFAAKEGGTYAV